MCCRRHWTGLGAALARLQRHRLVRTFPPSVLPRAICALHLTLWSSTRRGHPYDDSLLFRKVCNISGAQKGQGQEHAAFPSTEKQLNKNFSFTTFLLVFQPLMLHKKSWKYQPARIQNHLSTKGCPQHHFYRGLATFLWRGWPQDVSESLGKGNSFQDVWQSQSKITPW